MEKSDSQKYLVKYLGYSSEHAKNTISDEQKLRKALLQARFCEILEEDLPLEIIPFLKSLNQEERKDLAKPLKVHIQELLANYTQAKNGEFVILSIAAFVCLSYTDYIRNYLYISFLSDGFIKFHKYSQQDLMEQIKIEDILEWYQPEWLDKYINRKENYNSISYDQLVDWSERGFISVSDELLVSRLASLLPITYTPGKSKKADLQKYLDRLFRNPVTLNEHIWYLFQYPSEITYTDWNEIFRILEQENKIDRNRLLNELLQTNNRGFNRLQTYWFVDLFISLNPKEDELLNIQDSLFLALNSSHLKAVNNVVICLGKIIHRQEFEIDSFIGSIPVLLTSVSKSLIKTATDLAKKGIKLYPEKSADIAKGLCAGLVSKDEGIQKKLLKIITQYTGHDIVQSEFDYYEQYILRSLKPSAERITEDNKTEEKQWIVQPDISKNANRLGPENQIVEISSFHDFLFFINQAFNNNEPWHIFILPKYVQKFYPQIIEYAEQLVPLLKKADKNKHSINIGQLDKLGYAFLMSLGRHIIERFPDKLPKVKEILEDKKIHDLVYKKQTMYRVEIRPFIEIYVWMFEQIKNETEAELLSSPTHTPLWIDPDILVDRLCKYQENDQTPFSLDLQLALQRCCLDNCNSALEKANDKLKGEFRDLMLFLLDPEKQAPDLIEHPSWWMTASLTKSPYNVPEKKKAWGYDNLSDLYFGSDIKWEVDQQRKGYKTRLPYHTAIKQESTIFMEFYTQQKTIYQFFRNDVYRLALSTPHNLSLFEAQILSTIYDNNPYTSDSEKPFTLFSVIKALQDIGNPLSPFDHHFLAHAWLYSDKSVRDAVAAFWMDETSPKRVESAKLGEAIGKLNTTGWLPFKRLTDILVDLQNINTNQDRELICLIENILLQLPEPYPNVKKMLEIYKELLLSVQQRTNIAEKLESWKALNSVKKVITEIQK